MNKQKIRVLFISSWFPNKEQPTLGNFVEKHVHAVANYCNVMVLHVTFSDSAKGKRYDFDFVEENQIPVLRVYICHKKTEVPLAEGSIKFYLYIRAYLAGFSWLVKKYGKPDIIHANILYPISWIALLFHYRFKIPFVLTEHSTIYLPENHYKIKYFQLLLSRIAACKAKKITAVSVDLQKAMLSHQIKGNYEIIYNVVDTHIFRPNFDEKQNDKARFIHVSTLDDRQKNVSGIIRAVYKLSLIRSDFELCIVGDGDATSLIQLAKELGIYRRYVHFEGLKTSEEISFYMQNADCLLMFSNFESFSVVIAEALACGLPVIAAKAGGLTNELSKKQGIIISSRDETALVSAMNEMIEHCKDFDKTELAEFADRYSYINVGKSFYNLYNNIINH